MFEDSDAAKRDIGPPNSADKDMRRSRMLEKIPAKTAEPRECGGRLAVGP